MGRPPAPPGGPAGGPSGEGAPPVPAEGLPGHRARRGSQRAGTGGRHQRDDRSRDRGGAGTTGAAASGLRPQRQPPRPRRRHAARRHQQPGVPDAMTHDRRSDALRCARRGDDGQYFLAHDLGAGMTPQEEQLAMQAHVRQRLLARQGQQQQLNLAPGQQPLALGRPGSVPAAAAAGTRRWLALPRPEHSRSPGPS